jgi:hypothetical protein
MSQPEPIKAVIPRVAKMMADELFPDGSIFRCIPCGKQRNCTTSEIAEGIANGWPRCRVCNTRVELVTPRDKATK